MKNYFEMNSSKEEIQQALDEIGEHIFSPKTTTFSLKVSSLTKAQSDFYHDVAEYYKYVAQKQETADDYQNEVEYYLQNIMTELGISFEIEKTWAGNKLRLADYGLYL